MFSRDEAKQHALRISLGDDPRLRFFLGDIRDRDRLQMAMFGTDLVVHAAALKQVDTAERNPSEFIKTNIIGTENVVHAAVESGVANLIALSTDKASSPINLYGATKLTADKLVVAGNHYAAGRDTVTRMSVVRYGNVMGSRGSVVPLFKRLADTGQPIPITDERMTRFWIQLDQAVTFVLRCIEIQAGGELFVPKIPSIRVVDLAEAIAPNSGRVVVGKRPGEKLHEEMIASEDAHRTIDLGHCFVVLPEIAEWGLKPLAGPHVAPGFRYASDTNSEWLGVDSIRALLNLVPSDVAH